MRLAQWQARSRGEESGRDSIVSSCWAGIGAVVLTLSMTIGQRSVATGGMESRVRCSFAFICLEVWGSEEVEFWIVDQSGVIQMPGCFLEGVPI